MKPFIIIKYREWLRIAPEISHYTWEKLSQVRGGKTISEASARRMIEKHKMFLAHKDADGEVWELPEAPFKNSRQRPFEPRRR